MRLLIISLCPAPRIAFALMNDPKRTGGPHYRTESSTR
jgi:hypothetical protein